MILPLELQAARVRLVKERPYLASAVWALQPLPKPGLCSLAVDMYWRLYYDPAVFTAWPVEVIEGALYHELCHLLRNHPERMKGFIPRLSNIAADAEVNDDLIHEGVQLPAQAMTPQSIGQPEDLLAEEYYAALEKQNVNGETAFAGDRLTFEHPRPGSGRCGSCATGQWAPWEEKAPGQGSSSGLSLTEGELIRREVAGQIREQANAQGSVPAHWARWAEEKLRSKVDWRKQLAAAVRFAVADTAGAADYSYRRPSRRLGQAGNGDVVFPSLRRPVPSVAVVADTSGSISEKMLAQTLAEISGILKSMGQKESIHVLAVDQTVKFCCRVFRPEQIRLAGGGGTDMGVGLQAVASLKPLPQLGIVITDGYTSWPDRPPRGMKVIVVLLGNGKAPKWAKVIGAPSVL
jgi:predicted metal-dependent peptidase